MFQRILVPLDGSIFAEEALPIAARLAQTTSAELLLLRVVARPLEQDMFAVKSDVSVEQLREARLIEARKYLAHVIADNHLETLNIHTQILEGLPAPSLLHFTHTEKIDLVIMRSHGKLGLKRWLHGNLAQQFVRYTSMPLLILHDDCFATDRGLDFMAHPPRILVSLNGSALAEEALLPAVELCAALAAPGQGAIHLTYTIKCLSPEGGELNARLHTESRLQAEAYLKSVKQRFLTGDLAAYQLAVTTSVVNHFETTDIWKRVLEESECIGDEPGYTGCDIIAMATHGRHGLQRLMEGSITEQVMDRTQRPVLVVHTQPVEAALR